MEQIRRIKEDRADLTDYIIHFTRYQDGNTAFDILRKIVQDGYLKGGWSFRSKRNTVFGDKPAVCFTESPLYGFLDYVAKRNYKGAIDSYGIAVKKSQLYKAGGRSVL